MRILVTGSEGNVGSELVPYLKEKGHEVLCLDIVQRYRENYILCDILNLNDAYPVINKFKPQAIYHLAAMVSRVTCEASPAMAISTNIAGVQNMINVAKEYNALLINFSTSEVYGNNFKLLEEYVDCNPNNIYGLSKYMAEQLVTYYHNDIKYVNVRPFMMYSEHEEMGENRSAMIRFAENLIKGKPITVHKEAERGWLHMSDAVVLFERLLHVEHNITINIGNPEFLRMCEFADLMCDIAYASKDLINIEDLPAKMTLSKRASFNLQKSVLGYEPHVHIREGIYRVITNTKAKLGLK